MDHAVVKGAPQSVIAKKGHLGEFPPPLVGRWGCSREGIMMPALFAHMRPLPAALRRCALVLVAAAMLPLAFSLAAYAADADPVIARVNGTEIRASDLAIAEEEVGQSLQNLSPEEKRERLVSYLADTILVARAAELKKIPDAEDFKRRLAFLRNKTLMEVLLAQEAKAATTDEAMHKVYDDAVKQLAGQKEVHARHILVKTEEEAKAILEELKKGGDFAELAKSKSQDSSAAEGGDLGYFTQDQMVPEFATVAFKMEKGQISDPVKTQFGWHIIKVEDKRDKQVPPFDKVKDQIETFVQRRTQAEILEKLRQGATIERLDKAATPPAPAAPPAAPPPAKK
jgi:peptidyl-prolyl cis-trans isomerase C